MSTIGIRAIMSFPYRDAAEEWSQGYHLDGSWSSESDFQLAAGDLAGLIAAALPPAASVVRAYGYDDMSPGHAHTYTVDHDVLAYWPYVGTLVPEDGAIECPGDTSAFAWWLMADRSSRGKPVYLRKYFHAVYRSGDDPDVLSSAQATALRDLASTLYDPGANGHRITNPAGDVPTNSNGIGDWLTTRTLKRRGRRPPPP